MSWVQFHFKCRFFLQKINEGLTLQQTNKLFEKSGLNSFYSEKDLTGLQKALFDKIFLISSTADIKRALKVFSSIDMGESLTSPKAYKSITDKLLYLEVITAVFIMFITIYKLYVYPVFADLIQEYPEMGNDTFDYLPSMWLVGMTVALFTLVFTLSYRKYLKNIDKFVINKPSRSMGLFIPKRIIVEITALNSVITAPLNGNQNDDDFRKIIDAIVETGLDESVELTALFKHHSEKLELAIWQHSKRMIGVMYVLVILGISFYIMQIYQPLFQIGAAV
mgnify:CR=1 FL=1